MRIPVTCIDRDGLGSVSPRLCHKINLNKQRRLHWMRNTPMSCMLCFCTNDDLCNDALCSTALQYIMLCLNGLVVKHMPQGAAPA